ncbi:hypothetical protein QOZ80_3AG0221820 [Eleusine coracana subsp. coracana]|nr:hypothetical protein QOZ80_3AG0221820 [Eleusine coracana subsp. coracana]
MKPAGAAVSFSWEQEPGVSKQSPIKANKPAAQAPPLGGAHVSSKRTTTPPSTKKKQHAAETTAHPHRLRVPPPPGGPGAPAAVSPPGRRSRGVRPGDDPFLAAYLACTERRSDGGQKMLGWTGLGVGLGYGLGLRGFGLSCKSSCEAVDESSMVRMAKTPPKLTRNE